jgi:hypothetical protein
MPMQFRLGKGLIYFSFIITVTKNTKLWVFVDALQRKSISERQPKPIETSRGSPIQIVGCPLSGVVYFDTIIFYIIDMGYGCT